MAFLRRGENGNTSKVTAEHIPNRKKGIVQSTVRSVAEVGSNVYTDSLASYNDLSSDYVHQVVDHAVEFVRDNVHVNGMENFWSLLKRALKGTYVSVEPAHLQAYVIEQAYRFNERKDVDGGRFRKVLANVVGKRLTYQELITHVAPAA